jgi:hypothetical protein
VLVSKESFRYGVNNRLGNKTVFYPKSYTETRYKYSENKKYESYNYTFTNYVYFFNIDGLLTKKETYSGNTLLSFTTYTYNNYADVITERETDMTANVVKETVYEYEYDFKGNWITCVERKPDGNTFMRKRNITYY